jgi:hypothetical protein
VYKFKATKMLKCLIVITFITATSLCKINFNKSSKITKIDKMVYPARTSATLPINWKCNSLWQTITLPICYKRVVRIAMCKPTSHKYRYNSPQNRYRYNNLSNNKICFQVDLTEMNPRALLI